MLVDEEETARALVESIENFGGTPTPTAEEFEEFVSTFYIEDRAEFEFCESAGWLKSAVHVRTISGAGVSRKDLLEVHDRTE